MFWDPTLLQLLRVGNQFLNKTSPALREVSSLSTGTSWTVVCDSPIRGATAGSFVTLVPRGGLTWDIHNSTKITTEDVALFAGSNMGFHENAGGSNVYNRVNITRGKLSDLLTAQQPRFRDRGTFWPRITPHCCRFFWTATSPSYCHERRWLPQ